jgi:hypothetical protein
MNYYKLKKDHPSLDSFYDKVMEDNYLNNKQIEPVKSFLKANKIDIDNCFTYFGELFAKTENSVSNNDFYSISENEYHKALKEYNEFNGFE